jgi:hypothetical protein
MPSKRPVERGQRYRDLSPSRFGTLGTEWIVDAIFRGTDGIPYAQLVNVSDLMQHKTLAWSFWVIERGLNACRCAPSLGGWCRNKPPIHSAGGGVCTQHDATATKSKPICSPIMSPGC